MANQVDIILGYPGGFRAVCHSEDISLYAENPSPCWSCARGSYLDVWDAAHRHAFVAHGSGVRLNTIPWADRDLLPWNIANPYGSVTEPS